MKLPSTSTAFAFIFNVRPCNEGAGDSHYPSPSGSFGDAVVHTVGPRRALLQANATAPAAPAAEESGGFDLGTAGSAAGGAGAVSAAGTDR